MTKRFRGGIVSAEEVYTSPSGGSGVFSTTEQLQKTKAGMWQMPLTTSMQFSTTGTGTSCLLICGAVVWTMSVLKIAAIASPSIPILPPWSCSPA